MVKAMLGQYFTTELQRSAQSPAYWEISRSVALETLSRKECAVDLTGDCFLAAPLLKWSLQIQQCLGRLAKSERMAGNRRKVDTGCHHNYTAWS